MLMFTERGERDSLPFPEASISILKKLSRAVDKVWISFLQNKQKITLTRKGDFDNIGVQSFFFAFQ